MKHRILISVAAVVVACAFPASQAAAVPPITVEQTVYDGSPVLQEELSDLCGFPIVVADTGHFTGKVFFDANGDFRLFTGHPSFRSTFTSPYATIETSDRGLDKFSITQDGNVLVFGTGIHLKIKGVTTAVGLWRLVVDGETGELISQEYHGNFDVTQPEIVPTLCALLGPDQA